MENKLGVYYAFLDPSDTVDWLSCLRRTREAGLDILEMSAPRLRRLTTQARWEIADRAARLGLGLTLATALTPETDVSAASAAVRAAGVQSLREDLILARAMGATALGGVLTGVSKQFPPGVEHTRRETVDRAVASLREVAKAAEDLGVTLCVEAVNRFETPLVNTCEEALYVAEAVDSPRLGVHLDAFHMIIEEADPAAAIRLAGRRLAHFHACENNRALPGQGHIDWPGTFSALSDIGYEGPIVMEALAGPYGGIAARMNIWRVLSRDVDAELAAATCFLKERMVQARAV